MGEREASGKRKGLADGGEKRTRGGRREGGDRAGEQARGKANQGWGGREEAVKDERR